ncbi:hypothetical protein KC340_g8648 [Hortaea werneckii]|nr:hypothetical protein KC342_g8979 [Hortaea werneckii]KAI7095605.1 hypothetical protein KC339_g10931 [Hortaea werneckii]KAI7244975.1 hypothetical protein KC365_g882 [Hortaea werneckii]KAI7316461.1 hypothetical protein KC340_g8648 [Hortaea werneckii]KAI7390768.1 hypothetical protein KC328_g7791 [Hortaea werneckii]
MATDSFQLPPRKKPKISELPLSSAQRNSIDGMLHTFKKKGEFDALRKKAFQQYNESAQRGMFEATLKTFTADEIERDPVKYLKPDRRTGAPLLEGAAARGDVYSQLEKDINDYIDQFVINAESGLRDIRRKEIGDNAADDEHDRGNKSEEAYAEEAEFRRNDRAKKHAEDEKVRRKKEAQDKKRKELEALRKKQEELTKETERLQREQKRRAEREAWKQAEKERERERIKKYNEDREKAKKEAEEREKAAEEERKRRAKERAEREQKRLEEEALESLLREGKEMTDKGRRPELERSESMEPPSRLGKQSSATKNNLSREEMRAQGLMPTSMTLRKGEKAPANPSELRDAAYATPAVEEDRRRPSPSPAGEKTTTGARAVTHLQGNQRLAGERTAGAKKARWLSDLRHAYVVDLATHIAEDAIQDRPQEDAIETHLGLGRPRGIVTERGIGIATIEPENEIAKESAAAAHRASTDTSLAGALWLSDPGRTMIAKGRGSVIVAGVRQRSGVTIAFGGGETTMIVTMIDGGGTTTSGMSGAEEKVMAVRMTGVDVSVSVSANVTRNTMIAQNQSRLTATCLVEALGRRIRIGPGGEKGAPAGIETEIVNASVKGKDLGSVVTIENVNARRLERGRKARSGSEGPARAIENALLLKL